LTWRAFDSDGASKSWTALKPILDECLRRPLLNSLVLAGGQPKCMAPLLNQDGFNPAPSLVRCAAPTWSSGPVGMVHFGVAAGILAATAPSRSRSIARDNPVVTARLRSSGRPTRSRRSPVAVGEVLPEEATSLGGSSVHAARLSTWWKQPGGSLTRPPQLNPRRRRTACPSGPLQNRPFCRGNSGAAPVVYQFGRSKQRQRKWPASAFRN
jgi:hypothetical protein